MKSVRILDLATRVDAQSKTVHSLMTSDLAAFNKLIHVSNVPAVQAPKASAGAPE